MKKWLKYLTETFICLGVYFTLFVIWREIELNLYGYTQESLVDTVIGLVLSVIVTEFLIRNKEE